MFDDDRWSDKCLFRAKCALSQNGQTVLDELSYQQVSVHIKESAQKGTEQYNLHGLIFGVIVDRDAETRFLFLEALWYYQLHEYQASLSSVFVHFPCADLVER